MLNIYRGSYSSIHLVNFELKYFQNYINIILHALLLSFPKAIDSRWKAIRGFLEVSYRDRSRPTFDIIKRLISNCHNFGQFKKKITKMKPRVRQSFCALLVFSKSANMQLLFLTKKMYFCQREITMIPMISGTYWGTLPLIP